MIMLELFLTPHCVSAPSAIAVAKEAVKSVPDVELRIRSEKDYARAKSLGVFIFPSFVLDDEFIAIGEPKLEWLIGVLREKLKQKKGGKCGNDKISRRKGSRYKGQGNL
jgi:predicted DsbA family dithiol-disulfide isomerase